MPSVNDAAKAALNVTGGVAKNVVALTDKGPLGGFKKFISRGSMIDMAVGVVMGSAVTTVVNSIVDNLISPLIGMIGGVPDMSGVLTITFNNSTISFGAILNAIINFLLIGVAVYFCVILRLPPPARPPRSRRWRCCRRSATNSSAPTPLRPDRVDRVANPAPSGIDRTTRIRCSGARRAHMDGRAAAPAADGYDGWVANRCRGQSRDLRISGPPAHPA